MKDVYILGIESSCDETSMSIVKNGVEEIATTVFTQMDTHALYGGVVPEIASRMHTEAITLVLEDLLSKTNLTVDDVDAIAVTYAPGLLGSLLVGVEAAKVLSLVYNKPLIATHHIAGHIYANNLVKRLTFPLLGIVVSGGHTELVIMKDDYEFEVIGTTLDDAIGECFDKVARVLDLPYPGGPEVSKLASSGKNTYKLPKTKFDNYDFSFSGIKTAVINLAHKEGENLRKEDLACSFETTVCEELVDTTITVMKDMNLKEVVLAGGVSANSYLRKLLKQKADENNFKVYMPELKYCTDNAAMVGVAASYNYEAGKYYNIKDKMDLNAVANLKIDM